MAEVRQQIDELVQSNKVVLFMKGTRMFPQCGFSARAVEIFKRCGVKFKDVNVLADPAIRQGVKDYSNWPTIPQVYVDGQFVGGSDILLEMYETGELQKILGVEGAEQSAAAEPPRITITDRAAEAFAGAGEETGDEVLRFDVSPTFQYDLYFGEKRPDDFVVKTSGIELRVSPASAARANGTTIDFVDGPDGAGFKIDNPGEPPRVKSMAPADLKKLLDESAEVHLFDVRTASERQLARIEPSRLLDAQGQAELAALAKDARIVVYCHHGIRSKSAAEQLLGAGYTNVHNLTGGIDAWSSIDDSVPRY
jgi:monothiol glutaredoxin